jgi:hypothetical protein
MSTIEGEDGLLCGQAAEGPAALAARDPAGVVTQYAIVVTIVGLSVAATLRYLVTPQIVAQFEAIEAAFKRLPRR